MPKKGAAATATKTAPAPAAPQAATAARPSTYQPPYGLRYRPWIGAQHARTLVAIDPGDVHVGIAEFVEHEDSWECVRAYETTWLDGADYVAARLMEDPPQTLVVEEFRLYAELATEQIGSTFETSQLIGVIKYLHSCHQRRLDRLRAEKPIDFSNLGAPERRYVELVMQPANIQKAATRILQAKGVESEAGGNPHARSAELHGWHAILRAQEANSRIARQF